MTATWVTNLLSVASATGGGGGDVSGEISDAVAAAVSDLVNGAPGALDTLNELAAALGDDQNYATTIATALATKATLGGSFGTPSSINLTNATNLPLSAIASGAYGAAAQASVLAERDANAYMLAAGFIPNITTTATSTTAVVGAIGTAQTQVWTGTAAQTYKMATTSVPAGFEQTHINNSTGNLTIQSSAANTIKVLAPGQSARFTAVSAAPTTAAGWKFQLYAVDSDYVYLDSFTGTDDAKLTAAMAYASAQSQIPSIVFPARSITFSTHGRIPYSAMRFVGPRGSVGPKNLEISGNFAPSWILLNVGTGTSAWFDGHTATVYDVYMEGLAFQDISGTSQFWHQPTTSGTTLYGCEFRGMTFYGLTHIFGDTTNACAFTQVRLTGHWQVTGFTDTQFNLGGSDCQLWMEGYCNMGTSTAVGPGVYHLMLALAKTQVGFLYSTVNTGWKSMLLTGSAGIVFGCTFFGGVHEGVTSIPASVQLVDISGGSWAFIGTTFDFMASSGNNGVIVQSGGVLDLIATTYTRLAATAATFPFLYQTAGSATCVGTIASTGTEVCYARWADGTTTPANRIRKRVVATSAPGATPSINTDVTDLVELTGLAAAITSLTTNLTGTPSDGDELTIRFTDNATGRAITHGAKFLPSGTQALLTTTVASKTHVEKFNWDAAKAAWMLFYVDATGY
jgi:hypothetical protein